MQSDISAVHASESEFESEFSLVDAAIALGGEKVTLIVCVLLGLVAGGTAAVVMKPVFTAKTVIMLPQQQQSSAAAALASLGALAGAAGAVGGVKTPEEMYIALLGSDRIQTSIVNRFKLQEHTPCFCTTPLRRVWTWASSMLAWWGCTTTWSQR